MLRIKLTRSPIAAHWRTRRAIQAVGLRKINQVVERENTKDNLAQAWAVKEFLLIEDTEKGTILFDARTFRKHATRKQKKPCETTHR